MRTARIIGLGHKLPDRVVGERGRSPSASASTRTGSSAAPASASAATPRQDERTTDLALAAARRALTDADTRASEIDLVLVATMTPDELTPNTAPLARPRARASASAPTTSAPPAPAGSPRSPPAPRRSRPAAPSACSSIGAEILSRIVDPGDKRTAIALRRRRRRRRARPRRRRRDRPDPPRVRRRHERHDHRHPRRAAAPHGRPHDLQQGRQGPLRFDGRRSPRAPASTLDDIDLFVYHQANGRILRSVAEKLELPDERVADYVGETGNTSAASIPLTLSLLREDGRLRPGQRVLLAAVGAGFTWGAGVVEWGVR